MMLFRPRHPLRWLLWGVSGIGGGIGATVLAGLCLVTLVATLFPTAATTSGTGSLASDLPTRASAWTGQRNQAVVAEALRIAAALYVGPPHSYTTWYHAEQIPDALAYWQQTCTGGCAENWAQGNLQCTMLVTASYGLVGQNLPFAGDAATFVSWHPYRDLPGWQEVPPTETPWPGDIIVWDSGTAFGGAGHVAIVVDVVLPTANAAGSVQFAQSNGASALAQSSLIRLTNGQLHVQVWAGYTLLGYIRHSAVFS
jgi:surface antigen